MWISVRHVGSCRYALFQKISRADYPPLPTLYSEELRALAARLLSLDATARPAMAQVAAVAADARAQHRAAAEAPGAAPATAHTWRPELLPSQLQKLLPL